MIARNGRGAVRAEDAAAYAAYVQRPGMEGYRRTPGNRGAWLPGRVDGDRTEFVTMSLPEAPAAIDGVAGPDIDQAVFYRRTTGSSSSGTARCVTTRWPASGKPGFPLPGGSALSPPDSTGRAAGEDTPGDHRNRRPWLVRSA